MSQRIYHRPRLFALFAVVLALTSAPVCAQFGPLTPLPGDLAVAASAGNQRRANIAAGTSSFLAVWEDDASSLIGTTYGQQSFGSPVPGNSDIHGMLLDAQGARLLDAPIVIDHEAWDQLRPRAAWNGSEYLVVFQSTRPTSSFHSDGIWGVRVSAQGQVLDATPFVIQDAPGFDESWPVVASLGGTWLVAFLDFDPISQTQIVSGRVVTGPGQVSPRLTLAPGGQGSSPTELDLAAAGGRYALNYSVNFGSGIRARLFDATGAPTTAVTTLAGSGSRPGIAANSTGFYAAWLGSGGFRGTLIGTTGALGAPGGDLLAANTLSNNSSVQVGSDGNEFTVAFDSIPNVYAVRVAANGAVLAGPQLIATTPRWMDDIAVAGGNGVTQVLWTDSRATPNNFGGDQSDVWHATLDNTGQVSTVEALSVSPPAQFGARFAGDESAGYIVAFYSYSAGVSRILAQRVDARGQALALEPFEIASFDRSLISFDVATDGVDFVCVWGRHRTLTFGGTPPIVEFRRFRADGVLLGAAPVAVMEGDVARVDAVGRTYLIAAHYHHPSLQSNHVVRHRRLDGAGAQFLDAGPTVTFGGELSDMVALVDRWLLVRGGLQGIFVDTSGAPSAPVYYGTGTSPRVARNAAGTEALVAYEHQDQSGLGHTKNVRMQRIALDGTALDPQLGPFVSSAANAQLRPVGVALGDEYTFVWVDHRTHPIIEPAIGDVYACRLDRNAVQFDPLGLPLLTSPSSEGSVDLYASGPGQALFAASAITLAGPHAGVHRVRTGSYSAIPIGSIACVQPAPNSSGLPSGLDLYGSSLVADRALRLVASQLPAQATTLFLVSRNIGAPSIPPLSQGQLCLAGNIGRFTRPGQIQLASLAGVAELHVDLDLLPTPTGFVAAVVGDSWFFQAWHRDVAAGQPSSNFTDARLLQFR